MIYKVENILDLMEFTYILMEKGRLHAHKPATLLLLQILVVPAPYQVGSCFLILEVVHLRCKYTSIAQLLPAKQSVLSIMLTEPEAFILNQKGERAPQFLK